MQIVIDIPEDEYKDIKAYGIGGCTQIEEIGKAIRNGKPLPRGKWMEYEGICWVCNQCGEETMSTVMGYPRYNYCPICGADMRGDEE